MALQRIRLSDQNINNSVTARRSRWIADGPSDLPTSGMQPGDIVVQVSPSRLYAASSSTTLEEILQAGILEGYYSFNGGLESVAPCTFAQIEATYTTIYDFTIFRFAVNDDESHTVQAGETLIGMRPVSSAVSVFLPPSTDVAAGKTIVVKDETGNAATRNITIDADGTDTIDGAGTKVINTAYGAVRLYRGATGKWLTI